MDKGTALSYWGFRGDLLEVIVKDSSGKKYYKKVCRIDKKKDVLEALKPLEKFSGFPLKELLRDVTDWW